MDRSAGLPVPHNDEVAKVTPVERVSKRIVQQIADPAVPEVVEEAMVVPQERLSEHSVEQIAGLPVPQNEVEVFQLMRSHTVEQIFDMPVPQVMEEITEGVQHFLHPQQRVQHCTVEKIVDGPVPVPKVMDAITEGVKLLPQPQQQTGPALVMDRSGSSRRCWRRCRSSLRG